jgi:hypothetical protein
MLSTNAMKALAPILKDPRINYVYRDSDGYWAYLKSGYIFSTMDCGTLHESSYNKLLAAYRGAEVIKA